MMHTLRKAAVAVMFAILIGAFAISMGGNNYFDRFTHPTIAKVGSVEITPQQFQRVYQRNLDNLSARAGRRITSRQAQAIGLPQQVLQSLIQEAALDVQAKKLGLGLSEEGLRKSIEANDVFQDSSGRFSKEKYVQFLERIGYTAPAFEQEYKSDIVRRQIQTLFKESGFVPKSYLDAFNDYTGEQRIVNYFTIGANSVGKIETPSNETLQHYYDERKPQFMAPELRKVSVIVISPEAVAKRITISDEDLKAEYKAKAASYNIPERRKIEIIPFQTKEAAEAASKELKTGKAFLDVAKAAGFKESDVDLGEVSKQELAQKFATNDAVLKAAFDSKKDDISEPVNGPLAWDIVRVVDIFPGKERTFDEVKDQIRDQLIKARSSVESSKLTKAFEDDRAAGVPLADSAKKLNLPLQDVTVDASGNGADGKPAEIQFVPVSMVASSAFRSDVGVENEALRLKSGGYAWYEVLDIVKARQKSFDEVKADVEAAWKKDQLRERLAVQGKVLVARLDKHEAMEDMIKTINSSMKTSEPFKRDSTVAGLPKGAITQAFALQKGGAASAASEDGTARTIFQVHAILPPAPLAGAKAKALQEHLSAQVSNDNFAEYLTGIEKANGVTVDNKNFAEVAGGSYDSGE